MDATNFHHRQRTKTELESDVVQACRYLGALALAAEIAHSANLDAIGNTAEGLQRTLREIRVREVSHA